MKTCARSVWLVLLFFMVGCGAAHAQSSSKMGSLSSALILFTPLVEEVACCDPTAADMTDDELLEYIKKIKARKVKPFEEYALRVRRQDKRATVLVCSQDGSVALLEDAGCTFGLDVPHWQATWPRECAFTLDLNTVCPGP